MEIAGKSETFMIAGHRVEVEWKDLTGEAISSIRDAVRKDEFARAEILLLGASINRLIHDEKTIIRPRSRSARRSGVAETDAEGIPNDYDKETDELLVDLLLKRAVSQLPWLVFKHPFVDVFAQYADETVPEKDPTKSRAATSGDS